MKKNQNIVNHDFSLVLRQANISLLKTFKNIFLK